jgi:hypothetical protein
MSTTNKLPVIAMFPRVIARRNDEATSAYTLSAMLSRFAKSAVHNAEVASLRSQ